MGSARATKAPSPAGAAPQILASDRNVFDVAAAAHILAKAEAAGDGVNVEF